MANELFLRNIASQNMYAVVWQGNQVWNGSAFVAPVAANWNTYAIALSEVTIAGAASRYVGNFPNIGSTPALCFVETYTRAGGSPAVSDSPFGDPLNFYWDGSQEVGPHNAKLSLHGLDPVVCDTMSLPKMVGVIFAGVAGVISNAGTGTETYKGPDGTTTRFSVTIDASGNRSAPSYP